MNIQVLSDSSAVAKAAAKIIASDARAAVTAHGRFIMAISGGQTACQMLRDLADEDVPWANTHVFQVDERIAPAGDVDRHLTHLWECLLLRVPLPTEQLYVMPVEEKDLETAAASYAHMLHVLAGSPPILDLIHLGLGSDGHTASLVPNDAILNVTDADVGLTGVYRTRRRMTLTYPVLNRSRRVLWVVTGTDKAKILARLQDGDVSISAGRISRENAVVIADQSAAGKI